MENSDSNKVEQGYTREQSKAWIITLFLGLIICLGLVFYTLITHNLLFDYLDESLFNPGLRWLGFSGLFLYFSTLILFWIGSCITRDLPDKISLANFISLVGIIPLLISVALLFKSFDLENNYLNYDGFMCLYIGMSLIFTKDVIEYRFHKLAKIWYLSGLILQFAGLMCLALSLPTENYQY